MTQSTINLRSTSVLSRYVAVSDRLATLAKQLETLKAEEKKLRPQVLEEIGDRREIAVRGQVRVLLPSVKEQCGWIATDAYQQRPHIRCTFQMWYLTIFDRRFFFKLVHWTKPKIKKV